MPGQKGFEEPGRGRGGHEEHETPGRSQSDKDRDRDLSGDREKSHESPTKHPGERSPREPRT